MGVLLEMYRKSLAWLLILAAILNHLLCPAFAAELPDEAPVPDAYMELYPTEGGAWSQIRTAESRVHTVLEGKSILFFGDSLMEGYGLEDYRQSWCAMLGSRYGMDVTSISISGSTFAIGQKYGYYDGGCYEPYVNRELPDREFDVIFVEGGGNDWRCGIPIGENPNSRDPYTFQGAVNVVIDRLQNKYPQSLIVFMTSWVPVAKHVGEMDYYEAMTQICASRDIPCYQARDPGISGINSADSAFRSQYFLTADDPWHLNTAGQALFLPTIAGWLEQQVQECLLVGGYYDVDQSQWFAGAVQYITNAGLMNGVADHCFAPETEMTRGMMVTVLYRAAGSPSVEGLEHPFTDVSEDAYYRGPVDWAYQLGIATGTDISHFSPDENITREQMVTMLYRQAVTTQLSCHSGVFENLLAFTDRDQISTYAMEPMAWAVESGIIQGMGDGTLAPNDNPSRAQVAAVLQRYFTMFL